MNESGGYTFINPGGYTCLFCGVFVPYQSLLPHVCPAITTNAYGTTTLGNPKPLAKDLRSPVITAADEGEDIKLTIGEDSYLIDTEQAGSLLNDLAFLAQKRSV